MNIIKKILQFNSNRTVRHLSDIKRIIVHHSGVSVLQTVETIHNYHKNTRGYAGIGYHFYVRKDGSTYEGRPVEWVGAHAYGANSDSIGICAEGDYDNETMGDVQKKALIELVNYLKQTYNISTVQGHREVCATSCPGANYPLEEIKNGQIEPTPEPKKESPLKVQVHVMDKGWLPEVGVGEVAGTTGEARQMEAVILKSDIIEFEYRVHVMDKGWLDWKKNGEVAGTTGENRRIEAMEIRSSVPLRVKEHIRNVGWMPCSKGKTILLGTQSKGLAMEAIEIELE